MKKILQNLVLFLFLAPGYVFSAPTGGSGNIASTIANAANQQIEESGKSLASIVNTISIVFGVLWIIILLLMAFFNIEAIKNHAKTIFGALVLIGIVYGLSASAM